LIPFSSHNYYASGMILTLKARMVAYSFWIGLPSIWSKGKTAFIAMCFVTWPIPTSTTGTLDLRKNLIKASKAPSVEAYTITPKS
jgi:hypothetical protein